MFKIGDRVKISEHGRQAYQNCAADGPNPLNFAGKVIERSHLYDDEDAPFEYAVLWDNGMENDYCEKDLTLIGG